MTLTEMRDSRELGKMGDNAWEFVEKFSPPKRTVEPVKGTFDDIRDEVSAKALADVHQVFDATEVISHLDGDSEY